MEGRASTRWPGCARRGYRRILSRDACLCSAAWAPKDIHKTREQLKSLGYGVSELEHRDYGQTEFFLTGDDGYSHCFGVPRHSSAIPNN